MIRLSKIWTTCLTLFLMMASAQVHAEKCLYVSSYHRGYAWSDGVEQGLRNTLEGHCELKQFDMDSKRHHESAEITSAVLKAKSIIDNWKPDVVITSDDNAAKHLIMPYFRDHEIPFVFCGVNWTAEEYGFPYRNVTGIIEIAPVDDAIATIKDILGTAKRAIYIGADTLTEEKNLDRFRHASDNFDLELDARLVSSTDEWMSAYKEAQSFDFVIIGSHAGINDWEPMKIKSYVISESRRPSVTNHQWMMPYALLGLTKIPEEHGILAGRAAIAILDGAQPNEIPIGYNKQWEIWVNESIYQQLELIFPEELMNRAKKIG